ncbi:MAG: LLM class F420-dependent oxidoreductase [Acidimicrobiia bacterium]
MHFDLNIGYWGTAVATNPGFLLDVESMGYRCIWAAEAYGSDAATVLGAIAAHTTRIGIGTAIMQMPARTPAMTAMTAATLDDLSAGRFRLGLGLSGPQVVEGWHGVAYRRPLQRSREYVEIVRAVLARTAPLEYQGEEYQIPFGGEGATGLGKALKLIGSPHPDVPVYLAAIGPRNVALAAEIADGWLPAFYSPERAGEVFDAPLSAGFELSAEGPAKRARFDTVASVQAVITDDIPAGRDQVRPAIALYLGGMGARGANFYNELARRYGFEQAAESVQDLYLAGDKVGAVAAVPDGLVDEVALVGPVEAVRDRLEVWRSSGVTALAIASLDPATLRGVVEAAG